MEQWARRTREAGVWVVPTSASLLEEFSPTPQMIARRARTDLVWEDPWARLWRIENLPRRYREGRDEAYFEKVAAGDAVRDTMVRLLYEAGVPILAGSDHPPGGVALLEELVELVGLGMSPFDALQAATILPARFLGIEDRRGTIEEGLAAEILLLDGNPLDD